MESTSLASDNRPAFFKIIFAGDSIEHLRIPPRFMKCISKELTHTAILKGPSGGNWHVKLLKTASSVYLEDGWQEFFRDNSLGDYEFLLFRYDGKSCFDVKIFDKNGCERVSTSVAGRDPESTSNQKRKRGRPRKNSTAALCLYQPITLQNGLEEVKAIPRDVDGEEMDLPILRMVPQQQKSKEKHTQKRIKADGKELIHHKMQSHPVRCFQTRELSIAETGAGIWQRAESFTSILPYFKIILKEYAVHRAFIVTIPAPFSQRHLAKGKSKIVLHTLKGRSWLVNAVPTTGRTHAFCGGWPTFVHDNHLQQDDACIFELVKENELLVHIFRIQENWIAAC